MQHYFSQICFWTKDEVIAISLVGVKSVTKIVYREQLWSGIGSVIGNSVLDYTPTRKIAMDEIIIVMRRSGNLPYKVKTRFEKVRKTPDPCFHTFLVSHSIVAKNC